MGTEAYASPHRPERVLSFAEVIAGLGVSKATFFRSVKRELPVVRLSDRRFGVRERDYAAYLERCSAQAA